MAYSGAKVPSRFYPGDLVTRTDRDREIRSVSGRSLDYPGELTCMRCVEMFAASPNSSTSGSKAYFLFKLHDQTSGESGRKQQLTTRLSSCIMECVHMEDEGCPIHTMSSPKDETIGRSNCSVFATVLPPTPCQRVTTDSAR